MGGNGCLVEEIIEGAIKSNGTLHVRVINNDRSSNGRPSCPGFSGTVPGFKTKSPVSRKPLRVGTPARMSVLRSPEFTQAIKNDPSVRLAEQGLKRVIPEMFQKGTQVADR